MATQVNTLPVLEFCHVCTSFTSGDTEKGTPAEKVWAFSFHFFSCIISFAFSFFGVPGIGSLENNSTQQKSGDALTSGSGC